jgi:hypothetical protein
VRIANRIRLRHASRCAAGYRYWFCCHPQAKQWGNPEKFSREQS